MEENRQVLRWDDESNGEIYTERDLDLVRSDDGSDCNGSVGSGPLYVVENGREYRLVPLQERMQVFEPMKVKRRTKQRADREGLFAFIKILKQLYQSVFF